MVNFHSFLALRHFFESYLIYHETQTSLVETNSLTVVAITLEFSVLICFFSKYL